MKTILYTTAAALIAIANPANAQILGGAGGIIGGAPIPSLPNLPTMPSLPTVMNIPTGPIGSVTNGSATGAATATANKSVNTRTGKASASSSASGSGSGSLTQSLDTPLNSVTANGAGSGSAAGSARADAQLFGTDAVRGTLHQTRDAAGNIVTTFQNRAGNLVTATHDRAGDLVIATREDPPLPLARLRARGQMTELRAADLRFTASEAAAFLNQVMDLNLSAEDIALLDSTVPVSV